MQLTNSNNSISVFGSCGTSGVERHSSQEKNEMSQAKFYISFENSKCPEYVTEKLYKIVNQNISHNPPVPIVMGSDKGWYVKNLPVKSFIHVDDFKSPYELAKYLLFLNSHNANYMNFLEWRRIYSRIEDASIRCKLCKTLLDDNFQKTKDQLYIEDFQKFWKKGTCASQEPHTVVKFP